MKLPAGSKKLFVSCIGYLSIIIEIDSISFWENRAIIYLTPKSFQFTGNQGTSIR